MTLGDAPTRRRRRLASGAVIALTIAIAAAWSGARLRAQDEFASSGDCQRRHGQVVAAVNDEHARRWKACRGTSACIRQAHAWKAEQLKRAGVELRACQRGQNAPPAPPRPEAPPTTPVVPPEAAPDPPERSPEATPPAEPPSVGPPDPPPTPPAPPANPPEPSRSPPRRPGTSSTSPVRRIVVLGDSVATTPDAARSFPAQLETLLQRAGHRATVFNDAVAGQTTAGALRGLDRSLARSPHVLIVQVGGNDGMRHVPVAQVRQNLTAIVQRARARQVQVLLCEARTIDLVSLLGEGGDGAYEEAFNRVTADVARAQGVTLVPFLLERIVMQEVLTMGDGLHPNAQGATLIARRLVPHVEPLLATSPRARAPAR